MKRGNNIIESIFNYRMKNITLPKLNIVVNNALDISRVNVKALD